MTARKLIAATATVAVLALTGTAQAASQSVGSGYIDWGVKQSFRNYITGPIAVGSIETTDGATRNSDGTFRWPVTGGGFDLAVETGEVRSKGTVHFSGHAGVLDVVISDPRPVITGETGVLYADMKSRSQEDGQVKNYPNVDVATLDLSSVVPVPTAGGFRYENIPATLTQNGSPAFGGFYDPGEQMDPVTFETVYGAPTPEVQVPQLKIPAKAQRLNKDRQALLARVSCISGPCTTKVPRKVKIEAAGETHRAKVIAPKSIGAGERAKVLLEFKRASAAALAGSSVRVSVEIAASSGGETARETAQVEIRVPR